MIIIIIFDELIYAQDLLKNGFIQKHKRYIELNILSKYFRWIGYSEEEIIETIIRFCKKYDEYFDYLSECEFVNKVVKRSKKYTLKYNQEVIINKLELDKILSFKNDNMKRALFVWLVLYKFFSCPYFLRLVDFNKLSGLKASSDGYLMGYIHLALKEDLIGFTKKNDRIYVKFSHPESNPIICITNYKNFILELEPFINPNTKLSNCIQCNSRIIHNSNRTKYCKNCAKEIWIKKHRKNHFIIPKTFINCQICNTRIIKKNNRTKYCRSCAKEIWIKKHRKNHSIIPKTFINCQICNTRIIKKNNRTKYCKCCAKEIWIKKHRLINKEWMRKNRSVDYLELNPESRIDKGLEGCKF